MNHRSWKKQDFAAADTRSWLLSDQSSPFACGEDLEIQGNERMLKRRFGGERERIEQDLAGAYPSRWLRPFFYT
jgi:hypothetical protein